MKYAILGLLLALMALPVASATSDLVISQNVTLTLTSDSGYYVVYNSADVNLTEILFNSTNITFIGLTGSQKGIRDTNTDYPYCSANSVNCTLDKNDSVVNITFTNSTLQDINLSFGPSNTTLFRYIGCGPNKENTSAQAENQTATYGIDLICNNATYTVTDIQINRSGTLNPNWTLYASNTSISANITEITGTWKTIYKGLAVNACTYIWHWANCSYVTKNPGVYIDYRTD